MPTTKEVDDWHENAKQTKSIRQQLEKISAAFADLKSIGVHEDILIAYLQMKTDLSKRDIKMILEHQDDFYKKLSGIVVKSFPE